MNVDTFLSRLEGVRQTAPNRWIARCSAHEDRSPSLTISEGRDGRILAHCFAGCPIESVVNAVGLTLSDIMPEGPAPMLPVRGRRIPAGEVLEAMAVNAMCVAILAADMARGRQLEEADKDKLFAIAGEFQEAIELAGATRMRDKVLSDVRSQR